MSWVGGRLPATPGLRPHLSKAASDSCPWGTKHTGGDRVARGKVGQGMGLVQIEGRKLG